VKSNVSAVSKLLMSCHRVLLQEVLITDLPHPSPQSNDLPQQYCTVTKYTQREQTYVHTFIPFSVVRPGAAIAGLPPLNVEISAAVACCGHSLCTHAQNSAHHIPAMLTGAAVAVACC
jgi:hypothetical protein